MEVVLSYYIGLFHRNLPLQRLAHQRVFIFNDAEVLKHVERPTQLLISDLFCRHLLRELFL